MKEISKVKDFKKPSHAEGKIRIDLLDPITEKVKDRREGKNYVFEDFLFYPGWINRVNSAKTVLYNNSYGILTDVPFLLGDVIGFGTPSDVSSGLYKGEYSPTNQVIAERTYEKTRWNFQYDWLTTQANGTINMIGLTGQYTTVDDNRSADYVFPVTGTTVEQYNEQVCDGRCFYTCSVSGIVSIFDSYTGETSTIDITAHVGSEAINRNVAYAPMTKKFYIIKASSSNTFIYEFSDSTFSTLLNTYAPANYYSYFGAGLSPLYIHDNIIVWMGNSRRIWCFDFVNDVGVSKLVLPTGSIIQDYSYLYGPTPQSSTVGHKNFVYSFGRTYTNQAYNYQFAGIVFDLATQQVAGTFNSQKLNQRPTPTVFHPYLEPHPPVPLYSAMCQNYAIAAKMLEEPIVKTEAYAMRATYELEVFW